MENEYNVFPSQLIPCFLPYFQLSGLPAQADPTSYSYLCPDGHLQPINVTTPCVWVAKPWPVIAARRSHAAQVQRLVTGLNHDEQNTWQNALLSLLETYHIDITPLDNVIPIDDYLDEAPAFQSAYSFPECNPPRSIVFCVTSIIQHVKCSWLQEASQVYGVQPNIQCVRGPSLDTCMDDVKYRDVDLVVVDQEQRIKAQRDYNLRPILYEFSQDMHDRYATIALVHKDSNYETFEDLKGAKVCLPSYEGPAYLSLLETLHNKTKDSTTLYKYFHHDSCLWHPLSSHNCPDIYQGDEGALRCLAEGGDVAFLSSSIYKQFTVGNLTAAWIKSAKHKSFKVLCPYGPNAKGSKFEYCYLHWTTRGHLMTRNTSETRLHEIYNSLRDIDALFGKTYKTETRPFTMYGVFDKKDNVIFRDRTDGLRGLQDLHKDRNARIMEDIYGRYVLNQYNKLLVSSGSASLSQGSFVILSLMLMAMHLSWL